MFTDSFTDREYPADPYPGRRPATSFVHVDGVGYPLTPVWTAAELDAWLAERDAPPLAGRTPVLAYGSNACPSKLTWLRDNLGLTGPVVALRARCVGYATVWAAGLRARDGQRPWTLVPMPDVVERHFVLLTTEDQLRALDVCEGADPGTDDPRYRRERLPDDVVTVDGPARTAPVQAYFGCHPDRLPALVDEAPARATKGMLLASDARKMPFVAPRTTPP
ncbi:MAG: gamma-glutamylcyclotransferase [Actinophytocola sp.]|nr:gamma-glutamylcyclotransferase [Actinophytocola sp.]